MSIPKIGILTVSDRASRGEYQDEGGPAVVSALRALLSVAWRPVRHIVPDCAEQIALALRDLCDREDCCLVITTGGTGPAPRDVTPEATEAVCHRMLPGFGELMRQESLKQVPTAVLSRQTAGIRGRTLLLNLPGKPSSIEPCLHAVFPAIPYCLDLIGAARIDTNPAVCKAFRPLPEKDPRGN